MFIRVSIVLAASVALAACQPAVPDSGRGVGFDSYKTTQQRRDAALQSSAPAPSAVYSAPLSASNDGSAAATAAETRRVLAATNPNGTGGLGTSPATNSGVEPLTASPSNAPPAVLDGSGISRENSFDAVSAQRGIEGDAAKIAANRAQYQTIQPEALPSRGKSGPNVVAYALSNTQAVGTRVYSRSAFNSAAKARRNCAKFGRPTLAQIAFLENGGPQRDRAGLDPDGDGFACEWDPAPFRNAAQG